MFKNENFTGSSAESTTMFRFILLCFTLSLIRLNNSIQFSQEGSERRLSFSGFLRIFLWAIVGWSLNRIWPKTILQENSIFNIMIYIFSI